MKEELRYLERLGRALSNDWKGFYRDYQSSVNFKSAQRNGAFSLGYSRGIRGIFPCASKWFRRCAEKNRRCIWTYIKQPGQASYSHPYLLSERKDRPCKKDRGGYGKLV